METINVQYNGTEMLYRLQTALLGMCNFTFMISLYLSSQTTKEQTCLIMQITSVGIILHFYTRGRSRGGREGRTPPLSEFQPLVMGLFATVHAPLQTPTPRSVFTRVIY